MDGWAEQRPISPGGWRTTHLAARTKNVLSHRAVEERPISPRGRRTSYLGAFMTTYWPRTGCKFHLFSRETAAVSGKNNTFIYMRRFTWTVPARGAWALNRAISNSCLYDTKMYFKKLFDKRFRRIFSLAF